MLGVGIVTLFICVGQRDRKRNGGWGEMREVETELLSREGEEGEGGEEKKEDEKRKSDGANSADPLISSSLSGWSGKGNKLSEGSAEGRGGGGGEEDDEEEEEYEEENSTESALYLTTDTNTTSTQGGVSHKLRSDVQWPLREPSFSLSARFDRPR